MNRELQPSCDYHPCRTACAAAADNHGDGEPALFWRFVHERIE
jgi:hypothetical protein